MAFVYFSRRGSENVFRIGSVENLPEKMKSSSPDHCTVETDDPAGCEAFLHNYFGSRRITSTKDCFALAPEEIPGAAKVAEGFARRFVPAQRAVERLSQQASENKLVAPGDREREIYRRLRELREEEYRIARRRELLELELKIIIGTAAGLEDLALWKSQNQSRFDQAQFKSEHPDLYKDYVHSRLVRRFQLL